MPPAASCWRRGRSSGRSRSGLDLAGRDDAGRGEILLKTADLVPGGERYRRTGPLLDLAAIQLARAGAPPIAMLETTPRENYVAAMQHVGGWWAGRRDLGKGPSMVAELRRLGVPVRRGVRGSAPSGARSRASPGMGAKSPPITCCCMTGSSRMRRSAKRCRSPISGTSRNNAGTGGG